MLPQLRILFTSIVMMYVVFPRYWLRFWAVFSAVSLACDRDTWLPFLGPAVLPGGELGVSVPKDGKVKVTMTAPPGATKIVYWAANTGTFDFPWTAYKYDNAGVADVEDDGTAELVLVEQPGTYAVGLRQKRLRPHIHYRPVYVDAIGGVQTIPL